MLIRFLRDFQSAHTGEVFYPKGSEVDLPAGALIVAEGAAEVVAPDPEPDPEPEPEPEPKADPKKGRRR